MEMKNFNLYFNNCLCILYILIFVVKQRIKFFKNANKLIRSIKRKVKINCFLSEHSFFFITQKINNKKKTSMLIQTLRIKFKMCENKERVHFCIELRCDAVHAFLVSRCDTYFSAASLKFLFSLFHFRGLVWIASIINYTKKTKRWPILFLTLVKNALVTTSCLLLDLSQFSYILHFSGIFYLFIIFYLAFKL